MSSWIKMRTNLHEDPRVKTVKRLVRASNVCSVTGALLRLWSVGDEHSIDGRLQGYTGADVNEMVAIPGFAEALADPEVDWLEIGVNHVTIKRFGEHNGASAKQRIQNADRQKAFRDRNAPSVTPALPDKIREDKNTGIPPNPPQAGGNGSAAKRKVSPKGDSAPLPGFDAFWSEFPDCERKVNRTGCRRRWQRVPLEPIAEEVMEGLRRWKVSDSWQRGFVPLPMTWLTQERWKAPAGANGTAPHPEPVNAAVTYRNL